MLSSNKRLYNIILENYPSLLSCRSTSDKHLNNVLEENIAAVRIPVTVSMKLKKTGSIIHQVIGFFSNIGILVSVFFLTCHLANC